MKNLLSFEAALACILSHIPQSREEVVPLSLAKGAILQEDVVANRELPPFDRVAMDGIAVGFLEGKCFVSEGVHCAGESIKRLSNRLGCLEVMTGAVLPQGASCVIRKEEVERSGNVFTLKTNVQVLPHQNIHRKGVDAQEGDLLLKKGKVLTPACIALLASLGKTSVLVKSACKISVLSTGDELVLPPIKPKAHQIYSSNAEAILATLDVQAKRLFAQDSPSSILQGIEQGLEIGNLLIISGGVSVGNKDFVPIALRKAGVQQLIYGVRQKPGKPFWFGKTSSGKLVFGLPGNPVAMLTSLYVYVLSFLKKTQKVWALLGEDLQGISPEIAHFILVTLTEGVATPLKTHGSGDLVSLAKSDGFILPKAGNKGELVSLWLW